MSPGNPRAHAEYLVEAFLDERLQDANEPPGLREAITMGVEGRVDEIAEVGGRQLSQLRHPSSSHIPDAYLHDEVVLEDELQRNAAGLRTALALAGAAATDPRGFEYGLAWRLAPTASWAMRFEASRVPRPPTRPPMLEWSLVPIPWAEDETRWPPPDAGSLAGVRQAISVTSEAARVTEAPFEGWVQLGLFERQVTLSRYPDIPPRHLLLCSGLEVCDGSPPQGSLPVSSAAPTWTVQQAGPDAAAGPDIAREVLETAEGPLTCIANYEFLAGAPDRLRGAGLHPFALTPRPAIVALLGLRPERPAFRHVLVDDEGIGLVGRLWRGFHVHDGNYTPLVPGVQGADIILRPDLFEKVAEAVGRNRLRLGYSVSASEGDRSDEGSED